MKVGDWNRWENLLHALLLISIIIFGECPMFSDIDTPWMCVFSHFYPSSAIVDDHTLIFSFFSVYGVI